MPSSFRPGAKNSPERARPPTDRRCPRRPGGRFRRPRWPVFVRPCQYSRFEPPRFHFAHSPLGFLHFSNLHCWRFTDRQFVSLSRWFEECWRVESRELEGGGKKCPGRRPVQTAVALGRFCMASLPIGTWRSRGRPLKGGAKATPCILLARQLLKRTSIIPAASPVTGFLNNNNNSKCLGT